MQMVRRSRAAELGGLGGPQRHRSCAQIGICHVWVVLVDGDDEVVVVDGGASTSFSCVAHCCVLAVV